MANPTPLTPRIAYRLLIPASELVFLVGLLISGTIFFRGKPFDFKATIISDLESPDDDPRGYVPSAVGTALSGAILGPAALVFYRRARCLRRWLARLGAACFTIGVVGAVAIGLLAPFTRGYSPLHIQLAYAAFIGIAGGIWFNLLAVRAAKFLKWFQGVVLLFLVYLYFGPDFFNNDHLLTSIALWEWLLCTDVGIALLALARAVDRGDRPKDHKLRMRQT